MSSGGTMAAATRQLFGLPAGTIVGRRIPKDTLASRVRLDQRQRASLRRDVEAIYWRHKLSPATIALAASASVAELHVFEIQLRQREFEERLLPAIAAAIPYSLLFVLTCGSSASASIAAGGIFYHTPWQPAAGFALRFEGHDLAAVHASLARQIAAGRLDGPPDLAAAVELDQHRQRLLREIAAQEKRIRRERQFNRQVVLYAHLKHLQTQLENLTHEDPQAPV